jgi:iron complex outermembrane receptor protein
MGSITNSKPRDRQLNHKLHQQMNSITRDPFTGLARAIAPAAAFLLIPLYTLAQDPDPVFTLPVFEVNTTQGEGYRTSNAATGTKSETPLLAIPSSVAIVTRDFIDDMASRQTIGDILKYSVAGAPPATNRNNFIQIRGQRFEAPFLDGMRVSNAPNELSIIDSVEVLKGPNALLYGTRAPAGGLINRVTKKPQAIAIQQLKFQYGSWGFKQAEVDVTGPIGEEKKLSYRVIGALQDDDGYRGFRDQEAVAGMLQYGSGNTLVRFQYMWAETTTGGELPGGISNSDGSPFIGGGRDTDYKAPWSFTRKETGNAVLTWIQRFGEWESRLAYGQDNIYRDDEDHRRQGTANLTAMTSPHRYFGQTWAQRFQNLQHDIVGSYRIAGMEVKTNLGWAWQNQLDRRDRQIVNLANGQRIGAFSRPTVETAGVGLLDILNPGLDSIPLPGPADRIVFGQYNDSRLDITNRTAYLAQSVDLFSDRFTVVAGAAYVDEKSVTENLGDGTQTAAKRTDESDDFIYSLAGVLHISEELKVYAQTATTWTPNQSSAQTPAGRRPPAVEGKSFEVGIKLNVMDGRLWGSAAVYKLELDGFASYNSGIDAFVVTNSSNEGIELEMAAQPVEGLDMAATLFLANIEGTGGSRVNQSFEESWSFWTKYSFRSGSLSGFYVGGGVFHRGTLFFASGVNSPGYTTLDLLAGYASEKWNFKVRVANVTDELYNIGSTGGANIDISTPPSLQLSLDFRF